MEYQSKHQFWIKYQMQQSAKKFKEMNVVTSKRGIKK
jgi:hypothetical protein